MSYTRSMLLVSEAEAHLSAMLRDARVDPTAPDVDRTVRAFRLFSRVPVQCEGELLIFACGTYEHTGEDLYYVDLVRQFAVAGDEGAQVEQLHCELEFTLTRELCVHSATIRSTRYATLDEFHRAVDAHPVWNVARAQRPRRLSVEQERV